MHTILYYSPWNLEDDDLFLDCTNDLDTVQFLCINTSTSNFDQLTELLKNNFVDIIIIIIAIIP